MLKKIIKFTDFEENEVVETHYFHLSKADLVEMEVSMEGGMQAYLQKVVDTENGKEIIAAFKDLIRRSYGKRTEEGRFFKSPQLAEEFMSSEAYSEFFMDLVTNADAASEFVNAIIPKGLEAEAAKIAAQEDLQNLYPTNLTSSPTPKILTVAEAGEMDADELQSGLAAGRYKLS